MRHNKHIKISILFLVSIFYFTPTFCQVDNAKVDQWSPQSPEVSSLGQFGTFPISYFTGTPQISIPLYTIKEFDIEIPITLRYSGSGIKVSDFSTWVGLGWNLMPGGYITRITVGDEFAENGYRTDFYEQLMNKVFPSGDDGSFYHQTLQFDSDHIPGSIDGDYLYNIVHGVYHQQDIYQFNFLGYSGKFYIDQDTKEAVILDKKDHIQIQTTPDDIYTGITTSWEVLLPNGIKLYFDSGDHEKISSSSVYAGCSTTLTWKLSRVLLVNGEEINFTYTDYNYNSISYYDIATEIGNYECLDPLEHNSSYPCPPIINTPNVTEPISIANSVKYLTKIESPSITIDFHLTSETDKPRLSYIEYIHKSNYQIQKKYNFEYSTFATKITNTYPTVEADIYTKYKLVSISESGIVDGVEQLNEPYFFEYYEDIGLPSYFSKSQDYWGYFNGINNSNLLPDVRNMFDGATLFWEEEIPINFVAECTANRGPDKDHMLQGNLHKIIYPTKGSSIFNFEPHEFKLPVANTHLLTASEIQNGSSSSTEPNLGGGLRIQEIINYDYDDSFISREKYIYENSDESSSGKLVKFFHYWRKEIKHYVSYWVTPNGTSWLPHSLHCDFDLWHASSTNYQQISFYDNYVGYNRVEIIKSDSETDGTSEMTNGKIIYYFKNYSHFHEAGIHIFDMPAYQYCPTFNNPQNGLVESIEYYNISGNKIKETLYDYIRVNSFTFRGIKGKFLNTHVGSLNGSISPEDPQKYELYFYPMHSETWKVEKITEISNIVNGIGVQSITSFDYSDNDFNLLMKKTTNTSESENTFKTTLYLYPFDYGGGSPNFINEMIANNIMTKPIEVVEYLTKNSAVTIINGKLITYKTIPFLSLPDIIYNYESNTTVSLENFKFSNRSMSNIIPPDGYNSYFHIETSYKENIYYDEYDSHFNLLQYHNKDDIYSSFIWGYNYALPVAKIVGANYLSSFALLTQDIQTLAGATLRSELNKIRVGLSDAFVTTYTFEPLFGMKSETDANNRTTYYEYDNLGRLKLILDQDGNILKHLDYHYQE